MARPSTKQVEQARLLLDKAAEDEHLLDVVMDDVSVADAVYGFHCQQAAEKMLKALLSAHGASFPRTHDLTELLNLLTEAGISLPEEFTWLDSLTPFAVELRYDLVGYEGQIDRRAIRETLHNLRTLVLKAIQGKPD
ncbi:MAG TPA: HEPN domain-containing protein [bacterium]|nr:HEPN domain-containing protein [bacterium]